MSTEVERYEPVQAPTLFGTELTPDELMQHVGLIADTLKRALVAQKLTIGIQGREHVKVEGWTTLGNIVGVYPVTVWTRELLDDAGGNFGWEARVEARMRNGDVVGAAESECRRSERTWSRRDSFALRSMAQTRATSKALRMPLGFVVSMAGYNPTPAEELDDVTPARESRMGEPRDARPLPPARQTTEELALMREREHGAKLLDSILSLGADEQRELFALARHTGALGTALKQGEGAVNIARFTIRTGALEVNPRDASSVLKHLRAVANEGEQIGGDPFRIEDSATSEAAERVEDAEVIDDDTPPF